MAFHEARGDPDDPPCRTRCSHRPLSPCCVFPIYVEGVQDLAVMVEDRGMASTADSPYISTFSSFVLGRWVPFPTMILMFCFRTPARLEPSQDGRQNSTFPLVGNRSCDIGDGDGYGDLFRRVCSLVPDDLFDGRTLDGVGDDLLNSLFGSATKGTFSMVISTHFSGGTRDFNDIPVRTRPSPSSSPPCSFLNPFLNIRSHRLTSIEDSSE